MIYIDCEYYQIYLLYVHIIYQNEQRRETVKSFYLEVYLLWQNTISSAIMYSSASFHHRQRFSLFSDENVELR